jgi:hypothetical protein
MRSGVNAKSFQEIASKSKTKWGFRQGVVSHRLGRVASITNLRSIRLKLPAKKVLSEIVLNAAGSFRCKLGLRIFAKPKNEALKALSHFPQVPRGHILLLFIIIIIYALT